MRRMGWAASATVAIFAAMASAQPKAPAAQASAGQRKVYTFSSRFYKITTDVEKDLAREVGAHVDAVFLEYSSKFNNPAFGPPIRQQMPLHVYTTQQAYLAMLRSQGVDGTGTGGMFFGGNTLAAFIGEQGLERMFHTLRHEGFHQFAHIRISGELPTWCNEGIAEYFGEAILVKNRLQPGQVPVEKLAFVQEAVKAERHIPFDELLNMSHPQWNQNVASGSPKAQLQYEQSWSIIHFLVHGDARYRNALNGYILQIARGADSRTAFANSFGTTQYKQFEEAWKKYILALQPNPEKTAAKRLQFIGQGMRWLQNQGESFASLEDLQRKLRERQFRVRYSFGHGSVAEMSSLDDDNFTAPQPPAAKKPATLELEPAKGDAALPTLAVRGLKHTVRLTWVKDPIDGELTARIVYE